MDDATIVVVGDERCIKSNDVLEEEDNVEEFEEELEDDDGFLERLSGWQSIWSSSSSTSIWSSVDDDDDKIVCAAVCNKIGSCNGAICPVKHRWRCENGRLLPPPTQPFDDDVDEWFDNDDDGLDDEWAAAAATDDVNGGELPFCTTIDAGIWYVVVDGDGGVVRYIDCCCWW